MVHTLSRPRTSVALLDDEPNVLRPGTCPMCHTRASLDQSALDAAGAWRCGRCGQQWVAARLTTVAAYAAWVADRERNFPRTSTTILPPAGAPSAALPVPRLESNS